MSSQGHPSDTGQAAEHAYTCIREQILSGERSGGEWLREDGLADSIGVSRTPVREALRRLAAEGLVLYQPNRGVQVQTWSASDLNEIYGLRSLLEPYGSRLAARTGRADCEALEALSTRMEKEVNSRVPDLDMVAELNNDFHRLIIEASGNARLTDLVTSNLQVPLVRHTFSRYSSASLQRSMAHHRELVDALRVGDPEWAESVMRAHVHAAWSVMRRYFDTTGDTPGQDGDSPTV
ncbi:MAG: GntR family transcriptional regulator [Terracoccus sp.]